MKNYKNIQKKLFLTTILLFIAGMVNITFMLFGLICFILPFYFYLRYKKKIWCQYICPRAGMYTVLLSKLSLKLKTPKILKGSLIRSFFVNYFFVSLAVVIFSTTMVAIGRVNPLTELRFFLLFTMPFELPQLISLNVHPAMIHLGYRIYSMVLTTVIIGTVLGLLYQPRTWCSVCPINSLTTCKPKAVKLENSLA